MRLMSLSIWSMSDSMRFMRSFDCRKPSAMVASTRSIRVSIRSMRSSTRETTIAAKPHVPSRMHPAVATPISADRVPEPKLHHAPAVGFTDVSLALWLVSDSFIVFPPPTVPMRARAGTARASSPSILADLAKSHHLSKCTLCISICQANVIYLRIILARRVPNALVPNQIRACEDRSRRSRTQRRTVCSDPLPSRVRPGGADLVESGRRAA